MEHSPIFSDRHMTDICIVQNAMLHPRLFLDSYHQTYALLFSVYGYRYPNNKWLTTKTLCCAMAQYEHVLFDPLLGLFEGQLNQRETAQFGISLASSWVKEASIPACWLNHFLLLT